MLSNLGLRLTALVIETVPVASMLASSRVCV